MRKSKQVEIVDIEPLNDFKALVYVKKLKGSDQISFTGNSILYALITARSRVYMFESMQKLEDLGCKIYSVSTDCIAFSSKKTKTTDLSAFQGLCLGQFRPDIQNIKSFSSLAPRNYNILFEKENVLTNVYKICGLMINQEVKNILESGIYVNLVKSFLKQDYMDYKFEQEKLIINSKTCKDKEVILKRTHFILQNFLFKTRANTDEFGSTKPFGYCENINLPQKRKLT